MSNQKLTALHKNAAKHHEQAAIHNMEAAKHFETGDYEKAIHQVNLADAHNSRARTNIVEADKVYAEYLRLQAQKNKPPSAQKIYFPQSMVFADC